MRRFLAILLMGLLAAVSAGAQERHATVELDDGRTFHGRIVQVAKDRVILEVAGEDVTLPLERVVRFEESDPATATPAAPEVETDPEPAAEDPPAGTTGEEPAAEPSADPDRDLPGTETVAPGGRVWIHGDTWETVRPPGPFGFFEQRLGWLGDRYLWLVPEQRHQVLSIGLLFLVVFMLSIQAGGLVANLEHRSFGRSLMASIIVLAAIGAQVCYVPFNPLTFAFMLAGNAVLWTGMVKVLYRGGFFNATTLFFSVGFFAIVSFLLLEVVDFLLRATHVVS